MQRANFAEFIGDAAPLLSAIIASIDLPEVRRQEHQVRHLGARGDSPDGAVDDSRHLDRCKGIAVVTTAQQASVIAGGAVAIRHENASGIAGMRNDCASILPWCVEMLERPRASEVCASVQAAIGCCERDMVAILVWYDGNSVDVHRYEAVRT